MDAILPSPLVDFDRPLDMVGQFHQRIERQCELVERLASHLQWRGSDAEAREVAAFLIQFFDGAVAHHLLDEEQDLFPILQQHLAARELAAARGLIARLCEDHGKLRRRWSDLRHRLAALSEYGDPGLTPEIARKFSVDWAMHIAREQQGLLPLAHRSLSWQALGRIGAAMAKRRGMEHAPAAQPAAQSAA